MMLHPRADSDYYEYDPSLAAAIVLAVAFGLTAIYHTYQLGRWKTWYFIPFLLGIMCKCAIPYRKTLSINY